MYFSHVITYIVCFYASFTDVNTSQQSQWILTTRCRHLFKAHQHCHFKAHQHCPVMARLHCPVMARLHHWAIVLTTATVATCRCAGAVYVLSTLMMQLPVLVLMNQVCVNCVLTYLVSCICSLAWVDFLNSQRKHVVKRFS